MTPGFLHCYFHISNINLKKDLLDFLFLKYKNHTSNWTKTVSKKRNGEEVTREASVICILNGSVSGFSPLQQQVPLRACNDTMKYMKKLSVPLLHY